MRQTFWFSHNVSEKIFSPPDNFSKLQEKGLLPMGYVSVTYVKTGGLASGLLRDPRDSLSAGGLASGLLRDPRDSLSAGGLASGSTKTLPQLCGFRRTRFETTQELHFRPAKVYENSIT
jgi:hypothetical protein